jgi:hypothetical protein
VVVADGVQARANIVLREALARIARRKRLDGALLALDVLLHLAARASGGVDLFRGDGDKLIPEEIKRPVLLEPEVNCLDGAYTGEFQEVLDF